MNASPTSSDFRARWLTVDSGRLQVDAAWWERLQAAGLDSFERLWDQPAAATIRQMDSRTTIRFELPAVQRAADQPGTAQSIAPQEVFLKRHRPASLWEHIKPWLNFQRPLLGARPEWLAIGWLTQLEIPTLSPLAFGEADGRSLLLTASLRPCEQLDHWLPQPEPWSRRRELIQTLARRIGRLHRAGLHHQDLYLCHWLVPVDERAAEPHLIDLGRVRKHRQLSLRWIVKDLSQMSFSSPFVSRTDKWRFFREYMAVLEPHWSRSTIRWIVAAIVHKSQRIARHTEKHGL